MSSQHPSGCQKCQKSFSYKKQHHHHRHHKEDSEPFYFERKHDNTKKSEKQPRKRSGSCSPKKLEKHPWGFYSRTLTSDSRSKPGPKKLEKYSRGSCSPKKLESIPLEFSSFPRTKFIQKKELKPIKTPIYEVQEFGQVCRSCS